MFVVSAKMYLFLVERYLFIDREKERASKYFSLDRRGYIARCSREGTLYFLIGEESRQTRC